MGKFWALCAAVLCLHMGARAVDIVHPVSGPSDIEVRLKDGSVIRGQAPGLDKIRIKMAYGELAFPADDVYCVSIGERVSAETARQVRELLKDLDDDSFTKRGEAQKRLEVIGAAAVEIMRQERGNGSPEVRNRIDALLKKLSADVKANIEDAIKARHLTVSGTLLLDSLVLKSRFGDLTVKLTDVRNIRWLGKGETKTLTLEAKTGVREWVDTGVDVRAGENVVVACAGQMHLFGNNDPLIPAGTRGWGNPNPCLAGTLLARLGPAGKPFEIGALKKWQAASSERLYLRVFVNEQVLRNNTSDEQNSGAYAVKVSTAGWAEDRAATVAPSASDEAQNEAQNETQDSPFVSPREAHDVFGIPRK
jgi:hypothetical protein